jgi:hypothetical protein
MRRERAKDHPIWRSKRCHKILFVFMFMTVWTKGINCSILWGHVINLKFMVSWHYLEFLFSDSIIYWKNYCCVVLMGTFFIFSLLDPFSIRYLNLEINAIPNKNQKNLNLQCFNVFFWSEWELQEPFLDG